jgi:hypothetical protein
VCDPLETNRGEKQKTFENHWNSGLWNIRLAISTKKKDMGGR